MGGQQKYRGNAQQLETATRNFLLVDKVTPPPPHPQGMDMGGNGQGINGQVAVSALGSSCACPTAFITFCSSWRLQRIQFHRHVQPAPSLNGWGCDLQVSSGLGVHPGQWSLLHQVLLLARSHLALPGSGWLSVLRLKNLVGTGCRARGGVGLCTWRLV